VTAYTSSTVRLLGGLPRHGAVDVVPQRGDAGELHHGRALREGGSGFEVAHPATQDVIGRRSTHDGLKHLVGLAKNPVARHARGFPDTLALDYGAGAAWQTLEVRAHVDVPGADFGRGGLTAYRPGTNYP